VRPAESRACVAPGGSAPPCGTPVEDPGRSSTTQCTNVPPGASGSSTTSASAAALPVPDQASGGDWPDPAQVNWRGIVAPAANAGLRSEERRVGKECRSG